MRKTKKRKQDQGLTQKMMLDSIFKTLGDLGCTGGIAFADDNPNGRATLITKDEKTGEYIETTGKVKDVLKP